MSTKTLQRYEFRFSRQPIYHGQGGPVNPPVRVIDEKQNHQFIRQVSLNGLVLWPAAFKEN
jgi:hypothetical protein